MRRPCTGATSGSGRNNSTSTPTGTIAMRDGSTWWSATMSLKEFSDTVMTRWSRLATRLCMVVNEYQRRRVRRRFQPSASAEVLPGPEAEGEGLRELAGRERSDLDEVGPALQLPQPRHAHREVVVVDVEARQLDQVDPGVENGVGLAAQHLDVVPEVGKGLGQVPYVHALAANVGLPAVREQRDAQRTLLAMHSRNLSFA